MSEADPTLEDMRRIIREEMRDMKHLVERHDRALYGDNGSPGLKTELATVRKDVQANNRLRHHIYGIYGVGGLGGLTGAWMWLKDLISK